MRELLVRMVLTLFSVTARGPGADRRVGRDGPFCLQVSPWIASRALALKGAK